MFFFLFSVGTKDGTVGPNFGRPEGEGDERLAHILNEASHMMKTPGQVNNDDSRSNDDSCSPRTQCPSPFSNKVINNIENNQELYISLRLYIQLRLRQRSLMKRNTEKYTQ